MAHRVVARYQGYWDVSPGSSRCIDRRFPGLSEEYRKRWENAYEVTSPHSDALMEIFHRECEKRGVLHDPDACFRFIAAWPEEDRQLSLFDNDALW